MATDRATGANKLGDTVRDLTHRPGDTAGPRAPGMPVPGASDGARIVRSGEGTERARDNLQVAAAPFKSVEKLLGQELE